VFYKIERRERERRIRLCCVRWVCTRKFVGIILFYFLFIMSEMFY